VKILIMTAHPDDADIMAGGTMARWVDEGHDLHLVLFTRGDKGHDDPAMTAEAVGRLREAEQRTAAAILGVPRLTFLDFADGDLSWAGPALAEAATRLICQERPELVVTHDPYAGAPSYGVPQLHPDHRAVGGAVVDTAYFRAPGPLYDSAHAREGLAPHRVRELLLIMSEHADHIVDISATFDRKVRAVQAHVSQFGKHPDVEGFLGSMATRAGQAADVALGERFKRLVLR
jgi:LmbE family N-acetylglucosaminyl deacetylase